MKQQPHTSFTIAPSPGAGRRSLFQRLGPWRLVALLITLLVLVPVSVVLSSLFNPEPEIWAHLVENVLLDISLNTLWLVLGVAAGTLIIGVSLAWVTSVCHFPGRKLFAWALLLPLAVPAYVTAFVAVGLLDFTGPLQTWWRAEFGPTQFPEIRSRAGVIAVMVLAFYPYVYLIARNAFQTQGQRALEAAQSLGLNRWGGFWRVSLPMARPWIVGGVMLVVMETLADFGTVAVFNYDTFTSGIYKAWYSLFSLPAASQLASLLVIVVFVILLLEQQARARMSYTQIGRGAAQQQPIQLRGWRGWLVTLYATVILLIAFIVPVIQLVLWTMEYALDDLDARYFDFLWHSLLLATLTAIAVGMTALLLAYAGRRHRDMPTRALIRVSTMGYALPGPVLAVGTFIPIAWFDNLLIDTAQQWFNTEISQVLQGTLITMLLALIVRFQAVGFSAIDGHMQRITTSVDDAARSLGCSGITLLRRIHLPILSSGIFTGMMLVFVDVMKEMPITLMTRPFGWDTLAVRIFELTSEGEWQRAALPAIAIVIAGLLPTLLLTRHAER
jgi:iron(III) transport system permease protein